MPRQLIPGAFFGRTERELRTPSFEYAERIALVPDREVPEHTHPNAHFVLVVRGTYITEARNRPGLCGAATLIFNPTGTTHRDRFRSERGCFFTINVAVVHDRLRRKQSDHVSRPRSRRGDYHYELQCS